MIVVLSHDQVVHLLPMARCIDVMADAFMSLAAGEMYQPLRTIMRPPGSNGLMGLMPSYRSGQHATYALKAVCVFPGNSAIGKDAHQGSVMLFSAETGELKALINASAITAIRTAAVSALATRYLARADASELAIIGTGIQAQAHLEALLLVRPIKHIRIAGRSPERVRAFVERY